MLLVEFEHPRDQTLLEGDLVDCIDLDQQHDGQVRDLAQWRSNSVKRL